LFSNAAAHSALQSLSRLAICLPTLTLIDRYYKHHDFLIHHLINQTVAAAAQLDLVAIRQASS